MTKRDVNVSLEDAGDNYIDSLFFDALPKRATKLNAEEFSGSPVQFDTKDAGFIDQTYFTDDLSNGNAAECILDVRKELSVNEYSGGKLDFKNLKKSPKIHRDSFGYRVPDDDPIKFHLLTEDEASDVLYKCIIGVQENIIVINKPPGIACHGGEDQRFSVDSLLPRLAYRFRADLQSDSETFRLTHRIDKGATGLLLVSRNEDTHLKLTEAFANRWIRKSYLCITAGIPKVKEGDICLPISEKYVGGKYRVVVRRPPKNPESANSDIIYDEENEMLKLRRKTNAITHYNMLDRCNDTALIECFAVTGLKHQIRLHLSSVLDTPILGDHKYSHYGFLAPQRLSKRTLEALGIRQSKARYIGLHLHAHTLKFDGGNVPNVTSRNLYPNGRPIKAPPPGFFGFLSRENPREVRQFVAPVPSFFLRTLSRLRLKMPHAMPWTRFRMF